MQNYVSIPSQEIITYAQNKNWDLNEEERSFDLEIDYFMSFRIPQEFTLLTKNNGNLLLSKYNDTNTNIWLLETLSSDIVRKAQLNSLFKKYNGCIINRQFKNKFLSMVVTEIQKRTNQRGALEKILSKHSKQVGFEAVAKLGGEFKDDSNLDSFGIKGNL